MGIPFNLSLININIVLWIKRPLPDVLFWVFPYLSHFQIQYIFQIIKQCLILENKLSIAQPIKITPSVIKKSHKSHKNPEHLKNCRLQLGMMIQQWQNINRL